MRYVLIGLTAGAAGAVSFSQDEDAAFVGVMVAALVPPLVACGLCGAVGA